MTLEELKKAAPGSREFDELRSKAAAGDNEAGKAYVQACAWNALKKAPGLSSRRKSAIFRDFVRTTVLEVSVG